jgi:hypothetical protein
MEKVTSMTAEIAAPFWMALNAEELISPEYPYLG